MDQDLAVALGVLVLFLGTWGYALVALHRFVLPALRTGILQVRGRTYARAEQAVLFWLGITFWIAMAVLLAYPVIMVGMQFWRRFIA
jgi:hypothetical protein